MSVRALKNNDWSFGNSKRDLLYGDDEIAQNVVTRLKSFKNDWFLDTEAEIDWINILSSRNNKKSIFNNILRVCEATEGVARVLDIDIITTGRDANITVSILSVNNTRFTEDFIL